MPLEASRVSGLGEIIGKGKCRVCIIILRYIKLSTKSNHKSSKIIQEYKHFNTTVEPTFLSSSGSGTGSTQPREPREVN
jgi:hypothetical protein